jgi:hypothetical protein
MMSCPQTGLAVPECSCPRCLEEQLKQFQPALLSESRVARPRVFARRWLRRGGGRMAA